MNCKYPVDLTARKGNNLADFRKVSLLANPRSKKFNARYMREALVDICHFEPLQCQEKEELRRGPRAGSIAIYCAQAAVTDAKLDLACLDRSRIGV